MKNDNNSLFMSYLKNIKSIPKLSNKERLKLLEDNNVNLNRISESFLKLVIHLAMAYNKTWPDFDIMDLIQEGNLGLMRGIKQYNSNSTIKLSTYIYYQIKASIYDYIRLNTTLIHITSTLNHRRIFDNLNKEKKYLEQKGLSITPDIIADSLNVKEQEIINLDPLLSKNNIVDIDLYKEVLLDEQNNPEQIMIKKEYIVMILKIINQFRSTLRPTQQYIFDTRIITDKPKSQQYVAHITTKTQQNIQQMEQVIRRKAVNFLKTDFIKGMFNNGKY